MWVVWLATENITTGRIPLFYERDDAFLSYVRELIKDTATSRDELADELDKVWYMFSHIILSNYNLATEFSYSPLKHIECQNGFKMVVKQPGDGLILIAGISADIGKSQCNVYQSIQCLYLLLSSVAKVCQVYHLKY